MFEQDIAQNFDEDFWIIVLNVYCVLLWGPIVGASHLMHCTNAPQRHSFRITPPHPTSKFVIKILFDKQHQERKSSRRLD